MTPAPALRIAIDPNSSEPPFEQVRSAIIALVAAGELLAGSRLPTVRALADQLDIAPNTVARSYRELEAAEVIETRGRKGSFIAARPDSAMQKAQQITVEHVAALRVMGISDDAIASMLSVALRGR